MALLHFNSYLDRWKQKILQYACDKQFGDHLQRSGLSYKDFTLTAAQMDTLNATVVEVLAAPGAGLINVIEGITTVIASGATAFELGSGVLSFLYTDGSGDKVATDVPNATVEATANTTAYYRSVGLAVIALANAKVVAKASADVTAGTGTVYGRIWYRTVKAAEVGITTELT